MGKKYIGAKMIPNSRFVEYLNTMDEKSLKQGSNKVDAYIKENKEYCDKGNYTHLTNIFTCMALYRTLVENGMEKDAAEDLVFSTMYKYMEKQSETFKKLAKKGWFWPLIKKIVPVGFKKGSGYGWKYTWYKKGESQQIFRFECNSCIYQQIFKKYDLVRFGPKFCHNDIIMYGSLARTNFIRTGTLCRGDEKCDFKFVRYPKGEEFERTKSV